MAKVIPSAVGTVTIGTVADPDSINTGTQIQNARLSETRQTISGQAIEDSYPDQRVVSIQYQISFTRYPQDTDVDNIWEITEDPYAVFVDGRGVTLFAGDVTIGSRNENVAAQQFELQDMVLNSNGEPDTAPPVGGGS